MVESTIDRSAAEGVRATARAPEAHPPIGCSRGPSRRTGPRPIFLGGLTRRWVHLAAVSLLWITSGGCADSAPPALSHAKDSPETLVAAALEAMATDDQASLEALLVTREEYETLLWPEMPDGEYTPFDFVWSLASTNNRKGTKQALSSYGGMPLKVVSVRFPEQPEVYQSFKLHPDVEVWVRRDDTGEEGKHPSFDVLVEYDGWWKLLNLDEL